MAVKEKNEQIQQKQTIDLSWYSALKLVIVPLRDAFYVEEVPDLYSTGKNFPNDNIKNDFKSLIKSGLF